MWFKPSPHDVSYRRRILTAESPEGHRERELPIVSGHRVGGALASVSSARLAISPVAADAGDESRKADVSGIAKSCTRRLIP